MNPHRSGKSPSSIALPRCLTFFLSPFKARNAAAADNTKENTRVGIYIYWVLMARSWKSSINIPPFSLPVLLKYCTANMSQFMASLYAIVLVFLFARGGLAATFTLTNNCEYTVWPGVLPNAGHATLSTTGFPLEAGQSRSFAAAAGWSGRLWGRTLCSTDSAGRFSCGTGDCGTGKMECSGSGAAPPATLAELSLGGGGGGGVTDYYDVSLVDGYNLPMLVAPQGGSGGGCGSAGCVAELNGACPSDLRVVARSSTGASESVACKSACEAFGSPQYCCSGAYSNPNTCKPSSYSQFFKNACPKAYSYAYDDATSTFTCASANYLITFCPASSTSQKSSGQNTNVTGGLPANDGGGMVFLGGYDSSQASPPAAPAAAIAAISVTVLALSWLL